jgi:protein SCO1
MSSARGRGRFVALLLGLAVLGGIGAGAIAHAVARGTTDTALALPELHGQATWSSGERPAARFTLRDQDGTVVSLAELRGRPVLLTFLDSECRDQCSIAGRQLGTILRQMAPDDRPTLLVVSVNPDGDTPESVRHATAQWQLTGPWPWHWLRGTESELAPVWAAYGIAVEPTTRDIAHGLPLFLIDGRGFQRTGYLFPFLPNFVALDLQKLAKEEA